MKILRGSCFCEAGLSLQYRKKLVVIDQKLNKFKFNSDSTLLTHLKHE